MVVSGRAVPRAADHRAELAGVVHILWGTPGGCIVTDCLGVFSKRQAIRNGLCTKEKLLRGINADLWELVWEARKSNQNWSFEWVPSHRSVEEAAAAGISQDTWHGNGMADEAAEAQAKALDVPAQVLAAWAEQQEAHRAAWELIAESQVAHLARRPRRQRGAAFQLRKRKAPRRPCRSTRRHSQAPAPH